MRSGALVLALVLAACGSSPRTPGAEPAPAPRPPAAATDAAPELEIPARPTLADVLRMVVETPRLRAARAAEARARGLVSQADLAPNPIARIGAERVDLDDVGGGPKLYKVSVRERLETAGKRDARTAAAVGRARESAAETRAEELRITIEAARLHQRAVFSSVRAAALRDVLAVQEEHLALTRESVRRGRVSESELPALREAVGRRRIALVEEEERGRTALRALEGLLAVAPGTFAGAALDPLEVPELPDPVDAATRASVVETHPDLAVWREAEARARAELRQARAGAWPDVTVGLELTSGEEMGVDRETFGVSVEMPLPVLDRNQGAILAARAEEGRMRERRDDATADLLARYAVAVEAVRTRARTVEEYRATILPALERDLEIARAAHAGGRTGRHPVHLARIRLADAAATVARLEGERTQRAIEALGILGRRPGVAP